MPIVDTLNAAATPIAVAALVANIWTLSRYRREYGWMPLAFVAISTLLVLPVLL